MQVNPCFWIYNNKRIQFSKGFELCILTLLTSTSQACFLLLQAFTAEPAWWNWVFSFPQPNIKLQWKKVQSENFSLSNYQRHIPLLNNQWIKKLFLWSLIIYNLIQENPQWLLTRICLYYLEKKSIINWKQTIQISNSVSANSTSSAQRILKRQVN